MSFHKKIILGVAVLVGIALALIFLIRDSDEKLIEKLLEDGAEAAERADAEAVIALISKNYRNQNEDYDAVCRRIRANLSQRVGMIAVSGSAITVSGDDAEASVGVKVTAGPRPLGEFGLKLKLKKEEGAWKVTSAEETR